MSKSFDEAYAKYLSCLEKLDNTNDITEKNALFRQLTEQLSELEKRVHRDSQNSDSDNTANEEPEFGNWV